MKKSLALVLILTLVCAFALVGCAKKTPVALQEKVDAFLETAAIMEDNFRGELKISAEARDARKLVFIYTFTTQLEDTGELAAQLAASVRLQGELHEATIAELRENGVKNPAVVIEYRNADDSVLCTVEFPQKSTMKCG